MKVEIELKNGKVRSYPEPIAKVLVARGLGKETLGYQTREMRAEAPKHSEVDALKAEADKRGIKYHHRAGVAKLRELLEG